MGPPGRRERERVIAACLTGGRRLVAAPTKTAAWVFSIVETKSDGVPPRVACGAELRTLAYFGRMGLELEGILNAIGWRSRIAGRA